MDGVSNTLDTHFSGCISALEYNSIDRDLVELLANSLVTPIVGDKGLNKRTYILKTPDNCFVLSEVFQADFSYAKELAGFREIIEVQKTQTTSPFVPIRALFHSEKSLCVLTDYFSKGDFVDYYRSISQHPVKIHQSCLQMANALHVFHSKGLVHHDIHAGNFLVDENHQLFLNDWGLLTKSGQSYDNARYLRDISPPEESKSWSSPAFDIYQLGILFYLSYTGLLGKKTPTMSPTQLYPWSSLVMSRMSSSSTYFSELQSLKAEDNFPNEYLISVPGEARPLTAPIFELVSSMLDRDFSKRPTAQEVYEILSNMPPPPPPLPQSRKTSVLSTENERSGSVGRDNNTVVGVQLQKSIGYT